MMLHVVNSGRLTALERELADVRRAIVGTAGQETHEGGPPVEAGDLSAALDRPSLRAEIAGLADRLAGQDRSIAELTERLSEALGMLDELRGGRAGQQRRLKRLTAVHLGQAARTRAIQQRSASADLALRRLVRQIDVDAEQTARSMTALVERIGFGHGRARARGE